ncbi:patatin-like phospholipase family protein [Brevibacillus sp. H7]|uniref:patatin-like phospholipase family protein n=1 Tax=Brevibacillus sp. H7 TaxID=3349138 RepID=UPI00380833D2
MKQVGLVLQGGGTRGIYTSGVLDFFIEQDVFPSYVIAVSAGACNAMAYLGRDKGLGKYMYTEHLHDLRYLSWRNLLRHGSLLGMDFIFDEIPRRIRPFPFDVFDQAKEKLVVGATNCETGESVYFSKGECEPFVTAIRASCSIPLLSGVVYYQGLKLLDGGIVDPIPVNKSLADGNEWNIIVRTGNDEMVPQPVNLSWLLQRIWPRYQALIRAMFEHHARYNQSLRQIRALQRENRAFVLSPSKPVRMRRMERNPIKLLELYQLGYDDARRAYRSLQTWLES